MRKLKLQTQISIDGYCGGPNGELDFMEWKWDDGIKKVVNDIHVPVDTILLGRKMSEGFIPYWENVVNDPSHAEYEIGRKMVDTPKIVFSKTLNDIQGKNVTLANGDLAEEVNKLKGQPGGDIIAYGGSDFIGNLITNDLVDEYYLFVNPTAIGRGLPVFKEMKKLQFLKAHPFDCGVVMLNYKPIAS